MNMNDLPAAPGAASPEVFQQLGLITRQLHDALNQLGIMPKLQQSADGLSDARNRLDYIARKIGEAADKVLTEVELAKQAQADIIGAIRYITSVYATDPDRGATGAQVIAFVGQVEAAASRTDNHLTNIMLAQDFHDLTGQAMAKVLSLAVDIEDSLVKLLVRTAPEEQASKAKLGFLSGPLVDPIGRVDVVSNQGEVDDLLASLGF